MIRPLSQALRLAVSTIGMGTRLLVAGKPRARGLAERLGDLPTAGCPVGRPVMIRWDDHQIPFIEAADDDDLAAALGIVHGHLRWGQLELMRHLATGRISQLVGPGGREIDHLLRLFDFGTAVPRIHAVMPPATRRWLDRFVDGLNHVVETAPALPHELRVFGLTRTPWTAADVLTLGRLVSADFAWTLWPAMLACLRSDAAWPALWQRFLAAGVAPPARLGGHAEALLARLARAGSNVVAVAGRRSASGAPLLANDTHLGITLPNPWLIVGYRTPDHAAVGQMVPGIPALGLGRNADLAWGGANLQSANSDLFDVGGAATTRDAPPWRSRWWPTGTLTVRRAAIGPIVSDSRFLRGKPGETVALAWTGHQVSDELTALLATARATTWRQARTALRDFNVSALAVVCATTEDRIGRITATRLPRRPTSPPPDLVLSADNAWTEMVPARDLPVETDPDDGVIVAANNRSDDPTPTPLGFLFSADDRAERLRALIGTGVTAGDLADHQRDVHMTSAIALRDTVLATAAHLGLDDKVGPDRRRALAALADWDGRFDAGSAGALAYHLTATHLLTRLAPGPRRPAYDALRRVPALLIDDLGKANDTITRAALADALDRAGRGLRRFGRWGDLHRLRPMHPLGHVPVIGRWFRTVDWPADGSIDTICQTAHPHTAKRHATPFGAVSRFVCDLADPDDNRVVLLGGQDGWLGSSTFADQLPLWRDGRMIRVPLTPAAVAQAFPHQTVLMP